MSHHQNVQNLLNRYSLAYDTPDLATMANCFTEGATFSMRLPGNDPVVFEGKETIMKLMTDSLDAQADQRRHVNSNILVDDSDAEVTRTTHYLTLHSTENGQIQTISAGVYRCEIVDEGDALRFRKLHLDLDKSY
jgi:3-phenylpropionate/cinnamic acid dioxygenase small subunit